MHACVVDSCRLLLALTVMGGCSMFARAQAIDPVLPERPPVACSLPDPPITNAGKSLWNANLWSGGVVPYEFDANTTADEQAAIRQAMDALEAVANLHFVVRSGQSDYLHIKDSTGNYTLGVGNYHGRQDVNIYNWGYRFIMCHELMHALGLRHEQARSDRDQYITVNYANIQSGWASQYNIQAGTPVGPFDFDSVMCYGACDASVCCPSGSTCGCSGAECWTMTALPQYAQYQGLMGNRTHLSSGDIAGLVSRYGPKCPTFTQQPSSAAVCIKGQAMMSVAVAGTGPFGFAWQIDDPANPGQWLPVTDGSTADGLVFSGAATSALSISSTAFFAAGTSRSFHCVVTSTCPSVTSNAAALSVACPNKADVAHSGGTPGCDGQITVDDLVYYLTQFFANSAPVADLITPGGGANPDGIVTVDDLVYFLAAFFAGCA